MNVPSNLQLRIVLALIEERERRLRRTHLLSTEHDERRTVRRWIGHQLVAIGSRLANEPVMRPARAR